MSALPQKRTCFAMIVMSVLCHDDSGFYVAPIGQLTCMTAICSTASTNTLVWCRLRARTSGLPRVATSEQSV